MCTILSSLYEAEYQTQDLCMQGKYSANWATCLTWIFCYSGLGHDSPTPGQLIRLASSRTLPPVLIQPPVTHLSCHNMLTVLALHLWLCKARTFIISMTISRVIGDHSSSFYSPSISKSVDLLLCYCLIDLYWWTTKAVFYSSEAGSRIFPFVLLCYICFCLFELKDNVNSGWVLVTDTAF